MSDTGEVKNRHVEIWKYCGDNRDKTRVTINHAQCFVHDEAGTFSVNCISIEQYTDRFYLTNTVTQFGTGYALALKTYNRRKGKNTEVPSVLDWKISIWENVYQELIAENIFPVEQPI
jgi:hypothetical protein